MVDFPAIFGHEGAGTILALGSSVQNTNLRVGDAVLLSFNTCGSCSACTSGHPAFCHTHPEVNHNAVRISDRSTPARLHSGTAVRSQYFGQSSFAKTSVVNEKCVVKCPDEYKDKLDIYCAMGCGFQTGAGTVLNVLKPSKTESVVIFGLGSVGLCALMAAKYLGVESIIAVDIVDDKLALAKSLGASSTINSSSGTAVSQIKELTGRGANYSIDCTGIVSVIEEAVECIGPLGTCAIVGVPPGGKNLKIDPLSFLLENKKLVGVIEGDSNPTEFIPRLMEMHQAGSFPVDKLCKTYPIDKFEDALADIKSGKVRLSHFRQNTSVYIAN